MRRSLSTSLLMFCSLSASVAFARSQGISGKAQTGCSPCHGAGVTPGVRAVLGGSETLTVRTEGEYTLTLSGGPAAAGGFNVRAEPPDAVSFIPLDGQQLLSGELTHVAPMLPSDEGTFVFPLQIRAGATPGNVILYAAGNSVNLDLARTGDAFGVTQMPLALVLPVEMPEPSAPETTSPGATEEDVVPRRGCTQGGDALWPWALLPWIALRMRALRLGHRLRQ